MAGVGVVCVAGVADEQAVAAGVGVMQAAVVPGLVNVAGGVAFVQGLVNVAAAISFVRVLENVSGGKVVD